MSLILLFLSALFGALSGPFTQQPSPGDSAQSLLVADVKRTYVLHVPKGISRPVPLVLAFHGHLGTGANFSHLTNLDAQSDKYGFIVAYPDGIKRGWDDGRSHTHNDLAMVDALIPDLSKRYSIDRKRIYATGFSNGGMFTQYLACNRSMTIAAIAPDAGPMTASGGAVCHPKRAVSVLEIGGTSDPIVPYNGGQVHIGTMDRGEVWSGPDSAAFWAKYASCSGHTEAMLAPIPPADGTSVKRTTYRGCRDSASVVFYSISGGGHTWPGGPQYLGKRLVGVASTQLDASARIIEFFLSHPMR